MQTRKTFLSPAVTCFMPLQDLVFTKNSCRLLLGKQSPTLFNQVQTAPRTFSLTAHAAVWVIVSALIFFCSTVIHISQARKLARDTDTNHAICYVYFCVVTSVWLCPAVLSKWNAGFRLFLLYILCRLSNLIRTVYYTVVTKTECSSLATNVVDLIRWFSKQRRKTDALKASRRGY